MKTKTGGLGASQQISISKNNYVWNVVGCQEGAGKHTSGSGAGGLEGA